jgi:ABC-type sulfate transport system permease subunit
MRPRAADALTESRWLRITLTGIALLFLALFLGLPLVVVPSPR